ncbi:MAG: hypothetical protein HKP30_02100 [Myxococcales bacterium]|nr:hypothetical protein [Myxococcales bacterium]
MSEDLPRSRLTPGILVGSLFVSGATIAVGDARLLWLGVLTVALGAADALWQLRTAPVTLTPASLILRPALLLPTREVAWLEIASWAATKKLLGIRTTAGRTFRFPLDQLRPVSRARLFEQLESRVVPKGSVDEITARSLQRSHRTQIALALGIGFAIAAGLIVFLGFPPGA